MRSPADGRSADVRIRRRRVRLEASECTAAVSRQVHRDRRSDCRHRDQRRRRLVTGSWRRVARGGPRSHRELPPVLGAGERQHRPGRTAAPAVLRPQHPDRHRDTATQAVHDRAELRREDGDGAVPVAAGQRCPQSSDRNRSGPFPTRRTTASSRRWTRSRTSYCSSSPMRSGCSIGTSRSCSGIPKPSTSASA